MVVWLQISVARWALEARERLAYFSVTYLLIGLGIQNNDTVAVTYV